MVTGHLCHSHTSPGPGEEAETHNSIRSPKMQITKNPNVNILRGAWTALIVTLLCFKTYFLCRLLQAFQGGIYHVLVHILPITHLPPTLPIWS